ncbi:Rhodanese-like domain-containing protein [Xylaria sp. FL1777]|nr:Rhodanese-like domain-containing protein [Xylaria sp. FL1777]
MTSIPARRILTTSALSARPCLRSTAAISNALAAPSSLRATFSSQRRSAPTPAAVTRTARHQLRQQIYLAHTRNSVRWSTTSPTGSKMWTFEEVQSLTTSPTTPKPTLIDVREPGELQSTGRIPGSINIPITTSPDSFHITADEFEDRFGFARPEKGAEVVFYCKAGVRSRAAAGIAREAGWTDIGEFPGSWIEWSGKGGAVER